jgi:hypothetical protein
VLSAIAMQTAVEDLAPKFERATGHKLAIMFATLGGIVKRGGPSGLDRISKKLGTALRVKLPREVAAK